MTRVWSQFFGCLALVMLTGSVVTGAYFFDGESSPNNLFEAIDLNGEVDGDPFNSPICALEDSAALNTHTFTNTGTLTFEYDTLVMNVSGDTEFCDILELTAERNGDEVYEGPLVDFGVGGFVLASGESDEWSFLISVPESTPSEDINGKSCIFDTAFLAFQETFMGGQGFYDAEILTLNTIIGDTSSCVPTVRLYMDKHISGDPAGFTEEQFSYHIVGGDVDEVVPHGGWTPLPIGEYTIEELVPEGFVKEDWRIGWYGECERGSEYMTTITIDEGNIDHGWLDCQADNQYRPPREARGERSGGGGSGEEAKSDEIESHLGSPNDSSVEESSKEVITDEAEENEVVEAKSDETESHLGSPEDSSTEESSEEVEDEPEPEATVISDDSPDASGEASEETLDAE